MHSKLDTPMEVVFTRGTIVSRKASFLLQIFGFFLTLTAIVKTFFSKSPTIINDWKLFMVGVAFIIVGYFLKRSKFFQRILSIKSISFTNKRAILLAAIFLSFLLTIFLIRITAVSIDTYKGYFFGEGGVVEWSQVLVLLCSISISKIIINDLKLQQSYHYNYFIYLSITCLLVFITLEELAWGQVIFSWRTPEFLMGLNAQSETTFHNFIYFQNILDLSFLFISFFIFIFILIAPSISSLMQRRRKSKDRFYFDIFMPPRYSWPLFAVTLVISFFVANPLIPNLIINRDQEWAELFLYIGILISLLRTYVLLGSSNDNKLF